MRIRIEPTQVAESFGKFAGNPALVESSQLFARGLPVVEMLQAMALNENVLRAFTGLGAVYPQGNLERGIMEQVILRVSQMHDCQFCTASHLDIMHSLGLSTDVSPPGLRSDRERLAIEYAEQITRDANLIDDEFFARLRRHFSDGEIVELTFLTGLITMLNRFNNALGIRYHGEFADVTVH